MNRRARQIQNIEDMPRRRLFTQQETLVELETISSSPEEGSESGNSISILDISNSRPAVGHHDQSQPSTSGGTSSLNALGFPQAAASSPTPSTPDESEAESEESIFSLRGGETSSHNSYTNISVVSSTPSESEITLRMLFMQNKKLQEQLKKQNEELQEIRQNMRPGEANSRGRRVAVPRECSQSLREVYGKLYRDGIGGFNLGQIKTSGENESTISTLVREVRSLHGREKWSTAQIRKAAKTYFTSLRDKQRRMERGTYDLHALAAKKRSRKFRKLQRRQSALRTIVISGESRKEAKDVMTIDYMSSEESMSEGEEEGTSGCKTRRLLKLPWERSKLASLKHKLDLHFAKTAPPVVSRLLPEFVISNVPSSRPPPSGAPSWAVRPIQNK